VRRLLVVVLVGAALTVGVPAYACACGGLVDQPGGDTSATGETAIVVWDGASETIELRLATSSDAVSAGLLVPTPRAATVAMGDETAFDDLSRVIAPVNRTRRHLFGPPLLLGGGGGDRGSAGTAGPGPGGSVQVLATVDLGPLRATTLTTPNAAALDTWMRSRGLEPTPSLAAAVKPYVDEGWSFVAVQLTTAGAALDGTLPPIAMTFASPTPVYPMRMSSVATQPQQPLVYVLAAHRMQRSDPVADGSTAPELLFAGRVAGREVGSPALRQWLATTPYLAASTQWLPDPAAITSDFTFRRAPSDAGYVRTIDDDSYLIPADVAVLVVLLFVTAALLVRRARRSP
jgi:hypothetical protein